MINVATLYRFFTPFSQKENEIKIREYIFQKIETFLKNIWLFSHKQEENIWEYTKITYSFLNWEGIISFSFLNIFEEVYYKPVFYVDIFLDKSFLLDEKFKKRAVDFLTSLFECFDWSDEKDYLIDYNYELYYESWIFVKSKKYPHFDFKEIEKIASDFQSNNWKEILEKFISKYSSTPFFLSNTTSKEYHEIQGIFLYFMYLVFLMYKVLKDSKEWLRDLNATVQEWKLTENIELNKNRLEYVSGFTEKTFYQYVSTLNNFFLLFNND